jgi:hypothetical protein
MNAPTRPGLLTFGIVMTSIYVSLMLLLLLFAGLVALGFGSFAFVSAATDNGAFEVLPFGLALGAGTVIAACLFAYYLVVLLACARAWEGSRSWTIALIVFACLGLLNAGPISVVVNALTIVGATQALGRRSEAYAAG